MSGYRFDSAVNLGLLLDSNGFWYEEKEMKKIVAHSDLTDLDRNLSKEVFQKINLLKHAVVGMANGKFTKDDANNIIVPIMQWIKVNMKKTGNIKIIKSLKNLYLFAYSAMNKSEEIDKLAKVGLPGRSGRKPGYKFEEHEHSRGPGGKFAPKASGDRPYHPAEHIRTGSGKRLPSYRIEEGKRVGRGITSVPSDFTPAAVRMLGHIGTGMTEQAISEPVASAQRASSEVRSRQSREIAQAEALRSMISDPSTPSSVKAKAISSLENIKRRRHDRTGTSKEPTPVGRLGERVGAGVKAYVKELPYSLTVGAVQGALRGMVERFRTNPILAPLDIRVRPDILNAGLRTAVSTLKGKKIDRITEIVNRANKEGRHLSVEEYGHISSLSGMSSSEKNRVRNIAEGIENSNDPDEQARLEGALDDLIGTHMARSTVKSPKYIPAPKLKARERASGKADLPVYNFGSKHKQIAEQKLKQLGGK